MKNATLTAALSAAILTATAAQGIAAGMDETARHHGPRASFEELDADGDGQVTQAEMKRHMQARFEAADSDGDGRMSREELSERMAARQAEMRERRLDWLMKNRDSDGDGDLSMDEMGGDDSGRMFARLDSDGDGTVSRAEFEQMKKRHGMKRHMGQGGDMQKAE